MALSKTTRKFIAMQVDELFANTAPPEMQEDAEFAAEFKADLQKTFEKLCEDAALDMKDMPKRRTTADESQSFVGQEDNPINLFKQAPAEEPNTPFFCQACRTQHKNREGIVMWPREDYGVHLECLVELSHKVLDSINNSKEEHHGA